MLAEYLRLSADRVRVIAAFRLGLPGLNYRVQDEGATLHFGREAREGSLDLGRVLTDALREASPDQAIRRLLSPHSGLAEGVIAALPGEAPELLPPPTNAVLTPPRPGPVVLPAIAELNLGGLDELARSVIAEWFEHREVLRAFSDPLIHDRHSDTWATRSDWLAAARRFGSGEFRDAQTELIRLDLGVTAGKAQWLEQLRQVGWHGENDQAEIVGVYRYRHEMPDVARQWLAPKPFQDCPEAPCRAAEGDWIASRYLAASHGPPEPGALEHTVEAESRGPRRLLRPRSGPAVEGAGGPGDRGEVGLAVRGRRPVDRRGRPWLGRGGRGAGGERLSGSRPARGRFRPSSRPARRCWPGRGWHPRRSWPGSSVRSWDRTCVAARRVPRGGAWAAWPRPIPGCWPTSRSTGRSSSGKLAVAWTRCRPLVKKPASGRA